MNNLYKVLNIDDNFKFENKQSGYQESDDVFYSAKSLADHKDFVEFELDLKSLFMEARWNEITPIEMVDAIHRVAKADLIYPVIVGSNGRLLDGFHRVVKAIMNGIEKIPAKRLLSLPRQQ